MKAYIYNATISRMTPWCAGTGLAYLMNKIPRDKLKLKNWHAILGWIVCLLTILTIVFGYFNISESRIITPLIAAQTRLLWGIAVCWIIFACHYGYGDIINTFLSLSIWQPLAKLSFCMYLLHTQVMVLNYGATRYPNNYNFSEFVSILIFLSEMSEYDFIMN